MKKLYTQPSIKLDLMLTDIIMSSVGEDNPYGYGDLFD